MISKFYLLLVFYTVLNSAYSQEITEYVTNFKTENISDYNSEKELTKNYKSAKFIKELKPFYSDSLRKVRQKAYYLSYQKGLLSAVKHEKQIVNILLNGCQDNYGGIVGQNLSYLKQFPKEAFDSVSKEQLEKLLLNKRMPHHDQVILLAGYVGVGKAYMQKALLNPELKQKQHWVLSQALARQGHAKSIEYCLSIVKSVDIDNNFTLYAVPDLIYTRQKEIIDFCVMILNSDEELCYTVNPENPESCMCGYSVLENLAPIIVDFPWAIDETKTLDTDNYEQALIDARVWFQDNPNYQIDSSEY